MNFKRKRAILLAVGGLGVVYLAGPAVAAFYETGDVRGPKLYPRSLHEAIYGIAWDMGEHEGKKPRVPFDADPRPWFYGW